MRGRPKGSKNKSNINSFSQTLDEWDRMENEVDFKELCQKLQDALAKSYVYAETLEKTNSELGNEINRQSCIINYLEGRLK